MVPSYKYRHIRLAFLYLVVLLPLFHSENNGFAGEKEIRYTFDMGYLPAGADIAAMGDAGVVLPRRASSVVWNPASGPLTQHIEVSAEAADLYRGLSRHACFALRIPLEPMMAVSIVYMPFFSGGIPLFDSLPALYEESLRNTELRSNGTPLGYFTNNQHLIFLSFGKLFSLKMPISAVSGLPRPFNLSVGMNLKGGWQTMNPEGRRYMGVGVNTDAGIMASMGLDFDLVRKETSRALVFGITVRDFLPSEIIWIHSPQQYTEKMRYSHYYGISYVDKSGDLGGNWTFALALDKQYTVTFHAGIEAEFWNIAVFRAGLSGKTPTLGAGVHYKRYFMDYAFRFDKIDFSFLRLTLGAIF